jgi:hypothetical protein
MLAMPYFDEQSLDNLFGNPDSTRPEKHPDRNTAKLVKPNRNPKRLSDGSA